MIKSRLIAGLLLAVAIGANMISGASAQTSCGQIYAVTGGDTLRSIASALYRPSIGYQLLISANSNVLKSEGSLVVPGMELVVPCLDGSTTVRQVAGETFIGISAASRVATNSNTQRAIIAQNAATPNIRPNRLVLLAVGDGFGPFSGRDLPQRGMLVELAERTILKSRKFGDYRIDFIDDRSVHFDPLLSNNVYDFSLGWAPPECVETAQLSDDLRTVCDGYSFSASMFDETVQFYYSANSRPITSHAGLVGLRMCEARGWGAESALFQVGLAYRSVITSAPLQTREDCLRAVAAGLYDFTVLPAKSADELIRDTNLADAITVTDELKITQGLSAVINSRNPDRKELLAEFNIGLFKLRLSGEWYEIISRHMIDHNSRLGKI
ncbi:MAG: LysM peptidoglycan-binding domain-containing protein [Pikeienuella sp.]